MLTNAFEFRINSFKIQIYTNSMIFTWIISTRRVQVNLTIFPKIIFITVAKIFIYFVCTSTVLLTIILETFVDINFTILTFKPWRTLANTIFITSAIKTAINIYTDFEFCTIFSDYTSRTFTFIRIEL